MQQATGAVGPFEVEPPQQGSEGVGLEAAAFRPSCRG